MQSLPHVEVRLQLGEGSPPIPLAPASSFPLIVRFGSESFSCAPVDGPISRDDWTGALSFLAPETAMPHAVAGAEFSFDLPPARGMGRIIRILASNNSLERPR